MAGACKQSKPSFIWQAALILLPVILLSVLGWFSLRQDKRLMRRQAEERAQLIAGDLVQLIEKKLFSSAIPTNACVTFQVDELGRLVFPRPYRAVPEPLPLNSSLLSADQERLWAAGESDEIGNPDRAVLEYRRFLESNPPENFAAAAHYRVGVLLRDSREAVEQFQEILKYDPAVCGDSGLPLQPIARLKLLCIDSWKSDGFAWNSFYSNVVYYPTPLSPELLRQTENFLSEKTNRADLVERLADITTWRRVWHEQEAARELFAAASAEISTKIPIRLLKPEFRNDGGGLAGTADGASTPDVSLGSESSNMFWFHTEQPVNDFTVYGVAVEDRNWLAIQRNNGETNRWFICYSESQLGALANDLITQMKGVPDYYGFGLEIAGRTITEFAPNLTVWNRIRYSYKGGGDWKKTYSDAVATEILATSDFDGEAGPVRIRVYLTSPSALFDQQRVRAIWLTLLVGVSTLGALIGLIAAYRAFYQQLKLNEQKSNFVSSVSHELRAPIASVRLMAESLERGKISEPQKQNEYFKFIVQECRRLSSLIENVLDFSRIEQGRKQYEFEPTDLLALARETVRLMEPYAAEKGVELRLETSNQEVQNLNLETSDFELPVDGRAIQQALINLIDNAVKHSAKGQAVTLEISHQPSAIDLSVSDNGPGIPAAEHEKIFERFYRLGSELRRETQGIGIGLSIVKHIVEAHDGHVRVESVVGKGSRFIVELPIERRDAEAQR